MKASMRPKAESAVNKIQKAGEEVLRSLKKKDGKNNRQSRLYATEAPNGPWKDNPDLWEIAGITENEMEALRLNLAGYEQFHEESLRQWQMRLFDWGINMKVLKWLWISLGDMEGIAYLLIQNQSNEPFRFCFCSKALPRFSKRIYLALMEQVTKERLILFSGGILRLSNPRYLLKTAILFFCSKPPEK